MHLTHSAMSVPISNQIESNPTKLSQSELRAVSVRRCTKLRSKNERNKMKWANKRTKSHRNQVIVNCFFSISPQVKKEIKTKRYAEYLQTVSNNVARSKENGSKCQLRTFIPYCLPFYLCCYIFFHFFFSFCILTETSGRVGECASHSDSRSLSICVYADA